jgi:ribonuclease J
MHLIIHRGTNEIGGSCVELISGNHSLILDIGMPMVDQNRQELDQTIFIKKPFADLLKEGWLPVVEGLYRDTGRIKGILISHPHADHFGLLKFVDPSIPVYLGEPTGKIIRLNNIFLPQSITIPNQFHYKNRVPFKISHFKITPFLNDHSAFDSHHFLIQAEGKRIFYSGDFRSHGRKASLYEHFLKYHPKNIDYLILEGTQIGRKETQHQTEVQIEESLVRIFKKSEGINCIYTSGQNIDRLVTIYRACIRSGKTMVVDVYVANVLGALSDHGSIPDPRKGFENIMVFFPYYLTGKLLNSGYDGMVKPFGIFKARREFINKNPSRYVMIVRPSLLSDLKKMKIDYGNLFYSLWEGYKSKPDTKKFIDELSARNMKLINLHTSGHADIQTLKEFVNSLQPRTIIPIHTFYKQEFKKIFSHKVLELEDNEVIEL